MFRANIYTLCTLGFIRNIITGSLQDPVRIIRGQLLQIRLTVVTVDSCLQMSAYGPIIVNVEFCISPIYVLHYYLYFRVRVAVKPERMNCVPCFC